MQTAHQIEPSRETPVLLEDMNVFHEGACERAKGYEEVFTARGEDPAPSQGLGLTGQFVDVLVDVS